MLSRRLRAMRRDDRGMTLIEVVVAMSLLSVVGAMALNFFVGMSGQASRVTAQSQDDAATRTAINQIATVLRLADTPTARPGYSTSRFLFPCGQSQPSSTELVFFSNVSSSARSGNGVRVPPTLLDFRLAGGVLTEYSYVPKNSTYAANYDWTTNYNYACSGTQTSGTPTSSMVVLRGVTNLDVFSYCTATSDLATKCTPATTADSVAVVQLKLTVQPLRGNTAQAVQSAIAITGAAS